MNRIPKSRMTAALTSCVIALLGTPALAASTQDASAASPLRLSDLVVSSDSAQEASTPATTAGESSNGELIESASVTPVADAVSTDSSAPASRWSSVPLPGAEQDVSPTTQMGEVDGDGARDVLQVGGGLAGVLLLIWLLRTLIRKTSKSGAARGLLARVRAPEGVASIMARYPVARGEHVVLLEVGRRILVVHQASGSMTTLSELTDRDEVADMRARINGEEREKVEDSFAPALEASLEAESQTAPLEPVEGMPGFVAETVDLTRRKRSRVTGGAA